MNCIVTAGPTFEPLDGVRRLTNFSTGRLGWELAKFLAAREHDVTLLLGQQATYRAAQQPGRVETFGTTADLRQRLSALACASVHAVFHAAAVSDFTFGRVWARQPDGELRDIRSGKIPTREGALLAELVPTPKIIRELRGWYPRAWIVGWKYEVDGGRDGVIAAARKQIEDCGTDACVANGPAYGDGFGVVQPGTAWEHCEGRERLFRALESFLQPRP